MRKIPPFGFYFFVEIFYSLRGALKIVTGSLVSVGPSVLGNTISGNTVSGNTVAPRQIRGTPSEQFDD